MDEPQKDEPGKQGDEDKVHVIHVASFENPRPFETRKGAFHAYTFIPFIGWLPPVELNIFLFFVAILGACGLAAYGRIQRARADRTDLQGLRELRAGLSRFEAEQKRQPEDLDELAAKGYLRALPPLDLRPSHGTPFWTTRLSQPDDAGTWNLALSSAAASVFINCTHHDSRGRVWTSY